MLDTIRFFAAFTLPRLLIPALLLVPALLLLRPLIPGGAGRRAAYFGLAVYLSAVWTVCGLPDVFHAEFRPRLNLVPFVRMWANPAEAVLNILLFVPYGFALPLLWRKFRDGGRTVLAGFFLSLFIELMQLFSGCTDADDVILNTFGAWIGYLLACVLLLCSPKLSDAAPGDGTFADRAALFGIVFAVMFFLAPAGVQMLRGWGV